MLATVQYKVDGYPTCLRVVSYTIARSTSASGQQEPLHSVALCPLPLIGAGVHRTRRASAHGTLAPVDDALQRAALEHTAVSHVGRSHGGRNPYSGHWQSSRCPRVYHRVGFRPRPACSTDKGATTRVRSVAATPTHGRVAIVSRVESVENRAEVQIVCWLRGTIWANTATKRTSTTF
jgi:hypothetical protein